MEQELQHHWRLEKILTMEQAIEVAGKANIEGKKIVSINGSFDIIHAGHLDMLEEAKQQGDLLFVGLNSDKSIKDGKGPTRPFIPEVERAALVAALACVDYVVIVDKSYAEVPQVLIRTLKSNVHVNGSEYGDPAGWVEWPAMQEVGAQGYVVQRRPGLATSDIIAKIKASV